MEFTTLIPLATWVLFFVFLRRKGLAWRTAFLAASVFWGIMVTLITEFLSIFTALNRLNIAAGWTFFALAGGVLYSRARTDHKAQEIPSLALADKLVVVAISAILACTLVIAVVSPPNNWDSMSYHMSRVMHWFQQGSVAHFPTSILRQVELNPWAEFAILHFQALSGSDYLANLVQWFSMAGCIVGVSLIAAMFKASVRGQLLSALMAATIPMAILQSSSTQNDLVVSFWLICFIAFGIMFVKEKSLAWSTLVAFSLGLAILTKGTAYIFAFPFFLWFFVQDVKSSWQQAALKYLLLSGIVLSLNIGHYHRNYQLFNNPLSSGNDTYSNNYITPGVVLSNISRSVALHLWTPSHTLNGYIVSSLNSFHSGLGVGLSDPATTWPGTSFDNKLTRLCPLEDTSGNPLHIFLFLVVALAIMFQKNLRKFIPYTVTVACCFFLYCIMLRWQPWASRLHLPLFVIFSPIAGIVMSELRQKWLVSGLSVVLCLAALPWVLCNLSRPMVSLYPLIPNYPASIFIVPRRSQYFADIPRLEKSFLDAANRIKMGKFQNIGIRSQYPDSWEYPLWALTREKGLDGPRIEHVGVMNASQSAQRGHSSLIQPDVVIVYTEDGNVNIETLFPTSTLRPQIDTN